MTLDHVRTLFDYTYWARDRLYAAVERVPREDYLAARPALDYVSIHKTLVHLYAAELNWFRRLTGAQGLVAPDQIENLDSLRSAGAETEKGVRGYLNQLTEEDLARGEVTYVNRDGVTLTRPIWMILAQLVNHHTQHRSEIAMTISELGHSPGDMDLPVYYDAKHG